MVAYLQPEDIETSYNASYKEAKLWREHYPAYERLADNDLLDGLDPNLPEVNDGSLAASLFKLPKRVVSSNLRGTVKAYDRSEDWLSELAQMQWQKEIVPNANSQAPFIRKWKDAVRKSAIYGSVPLITLFIERNGKHYTDFIVAQPQDVRLEAGKVSDYDSDVMYWDVYFTKLQLEDMIEQAKEETAEKGKQSDDKPDYKPQRDDGSEASDANDQDDTDKDSYNKWDIPAMQAILEGKQEEQKSSADAPRQEDEKGLRPKGFHFCIVFNRGENAPFYMYHPASKQVVREWSNPDPTGDLPVHYLYCYQDFINPYGIGIVKLAGGTQNVLDYFRQADVLATQIGIRPPVAIEGTEDDVDLDSIVYAQDAVWFTGGAKVTRQEMANSVYTELPNRIQMYKTSLNQLIPVGDTSIGAEAGDPQYSKTPQGVQFQAGQLSIDDEDFKDNLYITYEAVARSMINTHFANMEGADLMTLTDDEREILAKSGLNFQTGKDGGMTNELEVQWDSVRCKFGFEVDPSSGQKTNDFDQLKAIQEVVGTISPQVNYYLAQAGWKFNLGEAYRSMFTKMNLDNIEDILTKMTAEEKQQAQQEPFPIIDPPQIRLTGQVPSNAMKYALQSGGVQVPDGVPIGNDNFDMGDFLKDPSTTINEKAQIKQMAGIQPDPNAQPAPPDAPGTDPAELDLKHRQLDLEQQRIDLEAHNQGHQQAMDIAKTAHDQVTSVVQNEQQQQQLAAEQANGDGPAAKTPRPTKKQTVPNITAPSPAATQASPAATKPSAAKTPASNAQTTPSKTPGPAEIAANVQAVMQAYNVDEPTALKALAAEHAGLPIEDIINKLQQGAVQ